MLDPHAVLGELTWIPKKQTIWVAYSGGLDSHVLLHCLKLSRRPIKAIHINHGLQAQSAAWARHCRTVCEDMGVECLVVEVEVDRNDDAGVEAAARKQRLAVFARMIPQGDVLMTGHHADDQLETVIMRWIRGSGVDGLGGIRSKRRLSGVQVYSPLLEFSRDQLQAFAHTQGLQWIEDPSNRDTRYTRNFLRWQLIPQMLQRFPGMLASITRSARLCREASLCLEELAKLDLPQPGATLDLHRLRSLSPARQANLVRYWLRQLGMIPPDEVKMQILFSDVIPAKQDAQPELIWSQGEIRRYQDTLYAILGKLKALDLGPQRIQINGALDLPQGKVALRPSNLGNISENRLNGPLRICFRQGGERIRLHQHGPAQSLKTLFQQAKIPPWERDLIPLLYCGKELVAVANHWVDYRYRYQGGLIFTWQENFYPSTPENIND